MKKMELNAGNTIFKKGDPSDGLYIVGKGSVGIYFPTNQMMEKPDIVLKANEILGEMGVIDKSLRAGRADAISDVTLIKISQYEFSDKLSKSDPFITGLTRVLVTRIRGLLKRTASNETIKQDIETNNQNSEA